MLLVHLTSSRFFGGPERQMLELARALLPEVRTLFVSFSEGGLSRSFLHRVQEAGFEGVALKRDTPRLVAASRELAALLRDRAADLLVCHGYKADSIGLVTARRLAMRVISVSRGWTGETLRVRLYEKLDRRVLQSMDRVVCVSAAQAEKVLLAGVPASQIMVIRNAIDVQRFRHPVQNYRQLLRNMFTGPPGPIIGAAGRLSPEKGFTFLVDAAAEVVRGMPSARFVVFGNGWLRESLQRQIGLQKLNGNFVLAGFRSDLDAYLPHFDVFVLPSLTEGLPNVALEALAAGVPVVATDVGGTGEVVSHGRDGFLVPASDPRALAGRISELLADDRGRRLMGIRGRRRMRREFSFAFQASQYRQLFAQLGLDVSDETPYPANDVASPRLLCEASSDR